MFPSLLVRQRLQFLNAVSHSVRTHSNALCDIDNPSESGDETDGDVEWWRWCHGTHGWRWFHADITSRILRIVH